MHRAAFHFIKALSVPSQVTWTGKRKCTQKGAEDDDNPKDDDPKDDDNETDNTDINVSMDVDASADNVEAMAETLAIDFEPGDTVGKLLAFVNQVWMSSEDFCKYLAHSCHMQNIKPIELHLWVRSCWGSLTHCLSATLEVQKVHCFFRFKFLVSLAEC